MTRPAVRILAAGLAGIAEPAAAEREQRDEDRRAHGDYGLAGGGASPRRIAMTFGASAFGTGKFRLYWTIFHVPSILRSAPVPRQSPYLSFCSASSNVAVPPVTTMCRSDGL